MWGSFKAAFAATIGALLAYGLVKKISQINLDDVEDAVMEARGAIKEATNDWNKSRAHRYGEDDERLKM